MTGQHREAETFRGGDHGLGLFEAVGEVLIVINGNGAVILLEYFDALLKKFIARVEALALFVNGIVAVLTDDHDGIDGEFVSAATQRFHMSRSIEYIRQDFGAVPTVIRGGGSLFSKSPANNSAAIAARMGFGVATSNLTFFRHADARNVVIRSLVRDDETLEELFLRTVAN